MKKPEYLVTLLGMMEEQVTKEDIKKEFSVAGEIIKALKNTTDRFIVDTNDMVSEKIAEITELSKNGKSESLNQVKEIRRAVDDYTNKQMKKFEKQLRDDLNFIKDKIKSWKEEKEANLESIARLVIGKLPDIKDGKDGETPTEEKLLEIIRPLIEKEAKKIRSGIVAGAGMSISPSHSPMHESFTMNGSDTTVTLSQGVSAGGKALWAYYNGQLIIDTTHYSVSGNKITLTFTPEADTTISVIYIP